MAQDYLCWAPERKLKPYKDNAKPKLGAYCWALGTQAADGMVKFAAQLYACLLRTKGPTLSTFPALMQPQ